MSLSRNIHTAGRNPNSIILCQPFLLNQLSTTALKKLCPQAVITPPQKGQSPTRQPRAKRRKIHIKTGLAIGQITGLLRSLLTPSNSMTYVKN